MWTGSHMLVWGGSEPNGDTNTGGRYLKLNTRRVAPPRTRKIPAGEVTRLLQAWGQGDATARDELIPVVYGELRRRAAAHRRHERRDHTLHPTDLIHETYLRLCAQNPAWQNRDQFLGVASQLMRRILVDHARARARSSAGAACA
jgi:RNA polymerase sigma factor (TIGR02999 family)